MTNARCLAAALAALLAPAGAFAAAPFVREPLRLTLRLDRKEYLRYEPIHAEWALVNSRGRPLRLPHRTLTAGVTFEYRQGEGTWLPVGSRQRWCDAPPPGFVTLGAGEAWRQWGDLRTDYRGMPLAGTFLIRAVCRAGEYLPGSDPDYAPFEVRSNELRFRVAEATGAEAAAVKLIRDHFPSAPPNPTQEDEAHPDPMIASRARQLRLARDWEFDQFLEDRRGTWYWRPGIREDILNTTAAPRFLVAARLISGRCHDPLLPDSAPWCIRQLRLILASAHASDFVKGLALLHLLRVRLESPCDIEPDEVKEVTRRLLRDYHDSAIADEARKLLAQHGRK